jgi:hypothetical protein
MADLGARLLTGSRAFVARPRKGVLVRVAEIRDSVRAAA